MAVDVNQLAQSFSILGIPDGSRMLAGDALPLRLEAGVPIGDAVITEVVTGAVDLDLLVRHVNHGGPLQCAGRERSRGLGLNDFGNDPPRLSRNPRQRADRLSLDR